MNTLKTTEFTNDQQDKIIGAIREQVKANYDGKIYLKKSNPKQLKKKVAEEYCIMLIGAVLSLTMLGYEVPMYWMLNLQCGRADRIFEEKKEKNKESE